MEIKEEFEDACSEVSSKTQQMSLECDVSEGFCDAVTITPRNAGFCGKWKQLYEHHKLLFIFCPGPLLAIFIPQTMGEVNTELICWV